MNDAQFHAYQKLSHARALVVRASRADLADPTLPREIELDALLRAEEMARMELEAAQSDTQTPAEVTIQ